MVSIIIPCRNEERFIANCLDFIIANDYPKDRLEVLVVDGMSEDGTREIVKEYSDKYPFIKLFDNPKKITPCAFNIGVKNAKNEFIMIMSAHAMCEKDYIRKCVDASQKYNADNVVGIWKILPRNNTLIAEAIVSALSTSFGAGNAKYRTGSCKQPEWVDTGAYGCYKRSVFNDIGLFNENLIRSQDMEFNLRLKRAGGKTLLIPDGIVYYYARSDFKSFCKYNFGNGVWAIYPFKFTTRMPVSLRHLVPLAFVSSLIASAALSVFSQIFLWLFLFILGSYALTNAYFSVKITAKEKDFSYLFTMPLIFATLHIGYGLGSLWGLLRVIMSAQFWKNRFSSLKGKQK